MQQVAIFHLKWPGLLFGDRYSGSTRYLVMVLVVVLDTHTGIL